MTTNDNDLLGEFDANVWAERFVSRVEDNPTIARDRGTMRAWFAGAIMSGYDHARRKDERAAPLAHHRIQVSARVVTAVRERIERKLGVVTSARPEGHVWAIYFDAPDDVELDFLRPDVLPPLEQT